MPVLTTAAANKTRKVGAPTPTPANLITNSDNDISLSGLRVQRLINITGVTPTFAGLVAPLIYGGAA